MAIRISLDNGFTYYDNTEVKELYDELIERKLWNVFVNLTEDDAREAAYTNNFSNTDKEFLARYMAYAKEDLLIG